MNVQAIKRIFSTITVVLVVVLLSGTQIGCKKNNEQKVEKNTKGVAVPSRIQKAQLPSDGILTAYIYVGDEQNPRSSQVLDPQDTSVSFTLTLPKGNQNITISFSFEDQTFGAFELAHATKTVDVSADRTNYLEFEDIDYLPLPDQDLDTISNLVELENGTDPAQKLATVFVNIGDANANDTNPGSKLLPFATINAAINHLVNSGTDANPGEVRVAQGIYNVNRQAGTHVILVEGISLYGGYAADWSARDTRSYITTIQDTSAVGGAPNDANRAVESGSTITTATVVDGFNIIGGGGDISSGFFNNNGSPTIRNNTVHGGSANWTRGIVNIFESAPLIENNEIHGGTGNNAMGIVNASDSAATIDNNVIKGGGNTDDLSSSLGIRLSNVTCDLNCTIIRNNGISGGIGKARAAGIDSLSASAWIYNNTIRGSDNASDVSYGIYTSGGQLSIQNNTINGDRSGVVEYGVYIGSTSTPNMENNIIIAEGPTAYCVYEEDAMSDPTSFETNNLFECNTALYFDEGSTALTDMASVNGLGTGNGNTSNDPQFVNHMFDWHLSVYTPAAISTGGIAISAISTDKDGNARTTWSRGAYTSSILVPNKKMFVTSNTYDGYMVGRIGQPGLAGADDICQNLADAAGLPNATNFRAWLSDSNDDAYCRMHDLPGKKANNCGQPSLPANAGPWVKLDGFPFSGSIEQLVADVVYSNPEFTELREPIQDNIKTVFTGTLTDGSAYLFNCGDWTDNVSGSALIGYANGTTQFWTAADIPALTCAEQRRLYCFETGQGTPLPDWRFEGKIVFTTSTSGSGDLKSWPDAGANTGLAAGDAICQARAAAAGLENAGSFKAWLSDSAQTIDAINRLTSNGPWVRPDGMILFTHKDHIAGGDPVTSVAQNEFGNYIRGPAIAWTGTSSGGSASAADCGGWNNSSLIGSAGHVQLQDTFWTDIGDNASCSTLARLYCFED